MIKSILVGLDGSEQSDRALDLACDMASNYKARLILVHALLHNASISQLQEIAERHNFKDLISEEISKIDDVPVLMDVIGSEKALLYVPVQVLRVIGKLYLDKAKSMLRSKGLSDVATHVVGGEPAPEILHYAQDDSIDLIVIGSRGLGDIKGLMLGSVSHKVLQQSSCPCLVVK